MGKLLNQLRRKFVKPNIKGFKTIDTSSAPLCETCIRCTRVRGPRLKDELVYCNALDTMITFPVYECNRYEEPNKLSKAEMLQMAWIIGEDKRMKKVGFIRPDEIRDEKNEGRFKFSGKEVDPFD